VRSRTPRASRLTACLAACLAACLPQVALARGCADLGYDPGPEWLAAHEAAVVSEGPRALAAAGLAAGLAAAYAELGHAPGAAALRAVLLEAEGGGGVQAL
jgi:hypothetical protein